MTYLSGILDYVDDEVVSSDFIGDSHASIFDARQGIQVNSHQVEFFFQVEVFMGDNAFMIFFRNQCEQAFRIHSRRFRFPEMQNIQSLFKESSDNLIFFYKESRRRYYDKFHFCC